MGDVKEQFEADSTRPSSSADLVSVEGRLAAKPLPAGRSVEGALVIDVKDGWHVNAHRPTYDYLIGTTLEWTRDSDVDIRNTQYPSPKQFHLDFADDEIDVYQGSTPIFFDVAAASNAAAGERQLTGRLRVQACNDRTCLQPSTVTTTLTVPVADANETATRTGDPVFEESTSTPSATAVGSLLRRHGLFIAGGVLVLGTVGFLVVFSMVSGGASRQEE